MLSLSSGHTCTSIKPWKTHQWSTRTFVLSRWVRVVLFWSDRSYFLSFFIQFHFPPPTQAPIASAGASSAPTTPQQAPYARPTTQYQPGYVAAVAPTPQYPPSSKPNNTSTAAIQQPQYTAAKPYVNLEDTIVEINIISKSKPAADVSGSGGGAAAAAAAATPPPPAAAGGGGGGSVVGGAEIKPTAAELQKAEAAVAAACAALTGGGAAPNVRPTAYVPAELPDRYAFLSVSK